MSENRVVYEGNIFSKGFGLMPKLVATDINLTIEAKAIYGYIASFAGNGESAFPKVKTMLYHLQISEKRYYKHMQLLIDNGYIEIQKRRRFDKDLKKWVADSNLYVLKQIIKKPVSNVSDNVNDNVNDNVDTYDKSNNNPKNNNVENVENTTLSEPSHFDSVQNESVQNESVQNGRNIINNNSSNKNNNNSNSSFNNSKLVVVDKEKELFDLYKTFNLEKRFMPHTKKLLQEYVDKFDLEVFEQVFISASSDSVSKKYAYIKKVFETLAAKNIRTLDNYLKDRDDYKSSKTKKTSSTNTKSKSDNKVKTKYHDTFNEHYKEYSSDELEEGLKGNQEKKGINNQSINEKLYIMACEIGLDSLSNDAVRSLVIDYAKSNNLEIPHR